MKKFSIIVLSFVFIFSFLGLSVAHAATAPDLGSTSSFGIVSSTSTNANTPPQTKIYGSVCGTTLNIPRPLVITGGAEETPCNPLKETDQGLALAILNSNIQNCTAIAGATLDGITIAPNTTAGVFPPGCYSFGGAMNITSGATVVLDATALGGDGGNVWIFKSVGGLTTGASTALNPSVVLANGASANNVFWAPGGATSLGANYALSTTPSFVGTIIDDAGISLGQFANLLGRALDFATTVTTDSNTITVPTTLTLIKAVAGSAEPLNSWTLSAVGPTPGISGHTTDATVTNVAVVPGEYTLSESGPSNYTATYRCVINGGAPTQILSLPGHPITLTDGDDAICTITNEANEPQLTLRKTINGGGSLTPGDFTLHAQGTDGADLSTIDGPSGSDAVINQTVEAGSYDLTETTKILNYTAGSWTCNGEVLDGNTITLSNGDDVTCTLENNYTAPVVHHGSSGSMARVVVPVFEPTITILSTPVVAATIIPKLPKTGFPPQEKNNLWNIVIGAGVLMLVSTSLVLVLRKRKI